jgi:hypothetical protein
VVLKRTVEGSFVAAYEDPLVPEFAFFHPKLVLELVFEIA